MNVHSIASDIRARLNEIESPDYVRKDSDGGADDIADERTALLSLEGVLEIHGYV